MSFIKKWLPQRSTKEGAAAHPKGEHSRTASKKAASPHEKKVVAGSRDGRKATPHPADQKRRGGRGRRSHARDRGRDPGQRVVRDGVPRVFSRDKGPSEKKEILPFDLTDDVMRVVPIGGCEQTGGQNMQAVCYNGEILLIDCGIEFGEVTQPGVDYVLPDVSYLLPYKDRIKALIITHGHLDHIGGLPHILPELGFPKVIGTRLTLGFAKNQTDEYDVTSKTTWQEIDPESPAFTVGAFTLDYFRVNHSIPDCCGVSIATPAGQLVITGDFKFDFSPADGIPCDLAKIHAISQRGVDMLMSDSTNALRPGWTPSEKEIVATIKNIIHSAKGRVILSTFSSLLGRVQHVIDAAHETHRKVFVTGRSMLRNIEMAVKLGYLKVPQGILRDLKKSARECKSLPDEKVIVLCTGSQGEDLAALSRIAHKRHPDIRIKVKDTVVFSATPIPGNERAVADVMDLLHRQRATVITNREMDLHTSGHGCAEDLKMMIRLMKPKYFAPVHGMFYFRREHAQLAKSCGVPEENHLLLDNGDIVEIKNGSVGRSHMKPQVEKVFIDGRGIGDVTSAILDERIQLAENGVIVLVFRVGENSELTEPVEVICKGFSDMNRSGLVKPIASAAESAYLKARGKGSDAIREHIQASVSSLVQRELDRQPVILLLAIRV